jgi:hypothetical protein
MESFNNNKLLGRNLLIGAAVAVAVSIFFWVYLRNPENPILVRQRLALQNTLNTIQNTSKVESYSTTEEDLFQTQAVQELVRTADAPLDSLIPAAEQRRCYDKPQTIPQFIENVKQVLVQSFLQKTQSTASFNIDTESAFSNINDPVFKTNFTNLGVLCIQLELMNSGRGSAIRITRDASNNVTYVQLDANTQNFLLLGLFNVLVDEPNLGATGEYMKKFIAANLGALDTQYFGSSGYSFRTIADTIRAQMTDSVSGSDWIANDENIAAAIQKASIRPLPVDMISTILIISMYSTAQTFTCSSLA